MTLKEQVKEIVSQMTLEEKGSLTFGKDFWHLQNIERFDLPSIMVTDGPHGLRKQAEGADHLGINNSVPATCFPTSSVSACSFNRELLEEIGAAIGEECREEDIAVVLGPGVNIKRSPLCGRNFEYFSEDPCLAGELAASFIKGVQSQNVGTSLKHFALNNQETRRMTSESVCDERAFHEIYLSAFERAITKGHPWTVMCSYNKLFGEYASDNHMLLTDILRTKWGFDGMVVSDWGSTNNHINALRAGMDLEMPGVSNSSAKAVISAVQLGKLSEKEIDVCAERIIELILKAKLREKAENTKMAHHAIAKKAAKESVVLLKNDGGLLPGKLNQSAAVIGAFAKTPRYQGTGSSKINPIQCENAFDELTKLGLNFDYADGYDLASDTPNEEKIKAAIQAARGKDIVYLFAGLPDAYESEGFDRKNLFMPKSHIQLIKRISEVNANIVVILSCGSVVDLEWENYTKAILLGGLAGQAGASAISELLLGIGSPSGKLAETWCMKLEDNPSYSYFPGYSKTVEYRESIYVGYRYYDKAELAVRYPFGYGLSYTSFSYDNLHIVGDINEGYLVSVDVTNIGNVEGAEVVQLYVAPAESTIYKAKRELKNFGKINLLPGEHKTITFQLIERDFAFYDVIQHDWRVENGKYGVCIGSSSRDIRCETSITIENKEINNNPIPDYREKASCYYDLRNGIEVSDSQFVAVLGKDLPLRERVANTPHTQNSTFTDIQDKWLGRTISSAMKKQIAKRYANDPSMLRMVSEMMNEAPLRLLIMSGIFTSEKLDGLVDMLNGKYIKGLKKLI